MDCSAESAPTFLGVQIERRCNNYIVSKGGFAGDEEPLHLTHPIIKREPD